VAQKRVGLGSASVIVFDESVDVVWLALKIARFFKHESCGKCTPCRVGTRLMVELLEACTAAKANRMICGKLKGWAALSSVDHCAAWDRPPQTRF